jgi:hypothetical protein
MADAPEPEATPKKAKPELPHCGVIMPISGTPDYPASHWADMLQLIQEAAKEAKFNCDIVSATGRDDIIHSSIVNNIYQNEIVVCDVSSRNPNVMLELGLRLASKLPLVVIFDGEGNYPFDIGTIRYLGYRRDMRYYDTNKFKKDLTAKILEVYDTYKKGNYKSFLSHFKNVDLNLDSIKTETQSLTQFLEGLDKRLSKFESQGSQNQSTNARKENISLESAKLMIDEIIRQFALKNGITIGPLPDDLAKQAFNHVVNSESISTGILKYFNSKSLMKHIEEWGTLPF